MAGTAPTLDEWRRLYDAAVRVKKKAPWDWMTETEIFGVQDPETGDVGFVSVMGMMGEHYAVAVYLGPRGFHGFWGLQKQSPGASPYRIFEVPQLQASFEDRDAIWKEDREVIKSLGLKFRGEHAWPLFRVFRPGFHPWMLEGWEVRLLACALEQTLEVIPRYERNRALLKTRKGEVLVRTPQKEVGGIAWEDRVIRMPPPAPLPVDGAVDDMTRKRVEGLPQTGQRLEIDVFLLPNACREGKARPFYPYCLLAVEIQMGKVLFHEMLTPVPSLEDMWRAIPPKLAGHFAKSGSVPGDVKVSSGLLLNLLKPLSVTSGFRLKRVPALRSLDPARDQLIELAVATAFFGGDTTLSHQWRGNSPLF